MLIKGFGKRTSKTEFIVALAVLLIGCAVGFLSGDNPTYVGLAFVGCAVFFWFVTSFEQAVISLLILRSGLDYFSEQQLPAAFALGLNFLTLLFVVFRLLSKKGVKTDWFWWFLALWTGIQSLWVILLPLGGLGLDGSALPESIREWVRIFSWLMAYLLVMQLKGRVAPQKIVTALFLSLIAPLSVAFTEVLGGNLRVQGTLGHYNNFGTFTLFFLALCLWKLKNTRRRLPWFFLSAVLIFFLVGSKSLTGLVMLVTFAFVFFLPRFNAISVISGLILVFATIALFNSTEFGQQRLAELAMSPIFNPDMDWSYATSIQLSNAETNSFNWRIAQWSLLLRSWQSHPFLGYGLATTESISYFDLPAHNDYIRFLVEEGIVGLLFFIVFLAVQLAKLIRGLQSHFLTKEQRDLYFAMLAFFVAISTGMLAGNIFNQTTVFFYWWTLMAVIGWDWKTESSTDSSALKLASSS